MASGKRCYYEVLEITREADDESIKKSYRRLAMKFHPDRNPGDEEASFKFKEATEAFEVLRDPQKRARYDRFGHAGLEGMAGAGAQGFGEAGDFADLVDGLFGGIFGGRGRRGPRGGNDLQTTLEIDLVEAFQGTKRDLKIPREETCSDCNGNGARKGTQPAPCRRCNGQGVVIQGQGFFRIQQTCPNCRGRGSVITDPCTKCRGAGRVQATRDLSLPIPAGIDDGATLCARGEGEAGEPGAPRGDLYVIIRIKPHPLFARRGADLHFEVPITFAQAALGGTLDVPTLTGKSLTLHIPKGSQTGDELRAPGKGMPIPQRSGRAGDLVVHMRVVTPRNLTRRQEELLRELGELDGKNVSPESKSFLDRVRDFFSTFSSSETGERGS
jgi:molecular chaperone DnaJ